MTGQARPPTDPLGAIDDLLRRVYLLETHKAHGHDSYELLGRTTLASPSDTISVENIPNRNFLRVVGYLFPTGGSINGGMRFNNVALAQYSQRHNDNGTESGILNQPCIFVDPGAIAVLHFFFVADILNDDGAEKLVTGSSLNSASAGAGVTPNRRLFFGKWTNNSSYITTVSVVNTAGTGDYIQGSELLVFGHN